jgi:ATP-dependent DNA helicase RecG
MPSVRQTGRPPTPPSLATQLQYLKGVGPERAKLLARKGLATVEDALFFLPIRHEDRTRLTSLRSLQVGQVARARSRGSVRRPPAAGGRRSCSSCTTPAATVPPPCSDAAG